MKNVKCDVHKQGELSKFMSNLCSYSLLITIKQKNLETI